MMFSAASACLASAAAVLPGGAPAPRSFIADAARGSSLPELPRGFGSGGFSAGVKECLTTEIQFSARGPRSRGLAGSGSESPVKATGFKGGCDSNAGQRISSEAAQPLTAGKDRHQNPRAKEPVAIPPCQGVPVAGGSSRRPVSRVTGGRRSADTASEATSRSGWKPRALPPFGCQPLRPRALTAAPRQAAQVPGGAGVPNAALIQCKQPVTPSAPGHARASLSHLPPASVGGAFSSEIQFTPPPEPPVGCGNTQGDAVAEWRSMEAATRADASVTRFEDHQKRPNPLTAGKDRQPRSGGVTFFAYPCQFRLVRLGSDPSLHPSAVCVQGEVGGVSGACSASQCGENRAQLVARQNQRCHSPCGGTKRPRAFPRSGGQPLHSPHPPRAPPARGTGAGWGWRPERGCVRPIAAIQG